MHETKTASDESVFRLWRPHAPPSLPWSLATYVVMFVPAIMGAVWGWPWFVTLALVAPGMVAHEILGYQAARARGITVRTRLPSDKRLSLLGLLVGIIGVFAAGAVPKRFVPLVIVADLLLLIEPIWRLKWRHRNDPTCK